MKKILALLMALSMVLCFAACGGDKEDESKDETKSTETGSEKDVEAGKDDEQATKDNSAKEKCDAYFEEYNELLDEDLEIKESIIGLDYYTEVSDDDKNRMDEIEARLSEIEREVQTLIYTMDEDEGNEIIEAFETALEEYNERIEEINAEAEAEVTTAVAVDEETTELATEEATTLSDEETTA